MIVDEKNLENFEEIVLNNTAIVFASRCGASKKVSELLADILRNKYSMNVDVINLKKKKVKFDLGLYSNVIIGSSIAGGRWTKEAINFLEQDFSEKRVAVFVTSGNAGEAIEKNDLELYHKWQQQYISEIIAPYEIDPVSIKAFGGRIRFVGLTLYNTLNDDQIKAWADQLEKLLQ